MNLHGAQTAFDNGLDGSKGYASLKSMKPEQDLFEICERDLLTRIGQQETGRLPSFTIRLTRLIGLPTVRLKVNGDKLELSFTTPKPSSTHVIEQTSKLPVSTWTDVTKVTFSSAPGNTLIATFAKPSSAPAFYRVRLD